MKIDSDRDYYMTAEEAKDYGIVDQVVMSRKEIKDLPGADVLADKLDKLDKSAG